MLFPQGKSSAGDFEIITIVIIVIIIIIIIIIIITIIMFISSSGNPLTIKKIAVYAIRYVT